MTEEFKEEYKLVWWEYILKPILDYLVDTWNWIIDLITGKAIGSEFVNKMLTPEKIIITILIIIVVVFGLLALYKINSGEKKANIKDWLISKTKVYIFGYKATLNVNEFINEQKERLEQMSADYIDNIYDINGESITHRFKERAKAKKEIPVALRWIPGFLLFSFIGLIPTVILSKTYNWISIFLFGILYIVIDIVVMIIKSMFPQTLKSCRGWAISENYFIQVLDGLVQIELPKSHIFYVAFNGSEVILDLDCACPVAAEYSGRDDRLVLEDLDNPEEVYNILNEWVKSK